MGVCGGPVSHLSAGSDGRRCLSENPSSGQIKLLLKARWEQKFYLVSE